MKNRKHDIERYLRGELSPAEMHALEKEALNDPFLAEALEGIEHAGADNFLFDLHALNKSVHYRARSRERKNKTVKMWGWTLGIAASVLLIAVSGFLVISLLKNQRKDTLAMKEEPNPLPATSNSKDSIATELEQAAAKPLPEPRQEPSSPSLKTQPADATRANTRSGDEKAEDEKEIISEKEPVLSNAKAIGETKDENASRESTASEIAQNPAVFPAEDVIDKGDKKSKRNAGISSGTPAPTAAQRSISTLKVLNGQVRSAHDGSALPGVNVLIKGTNLGTVTDGQGYYYLSIPADQTEIVFTSIGFESAEMPVGEKSLVNVSLTEDAFQLSEVVVTGSGVDSAPGEAAPFTFAEPRGGRSQFKNYLSNELQYPQEAIQHQAEGKVTIRFTVEPDGKLTDFAIIKGIGYGCEEEIIRLVKEGPTWKPSTKDNQPVTDQVRVRFRFELPENK
ncbi:MAG: TonB family protein [Cyclobacteriaceae bacterium]